jgi:hypothetical protein
MTFHLSQTSYSNEVILKIFNKMDTNQLTNQDNEISQQQFRNGFFMIITLRSALGLGNFNSEIYEDADQAFQCVDGNGNGSISLFEWKSHYLGRACLEILQRKLWKTCSEYCMPTATTRYSRTQFRDAFLQYSALR